MDPKVDKRFVVIFKTTQQKTQSFYKTVEAGDIALFDIFDEAIAVFGYTRVGKTSTCHYLCGSPLRSESHQGEFIYYPSTQLFNSAKVGLTSASQTEIPNIFETSFKDPITKQTKKIWLLDQPGYGDTYGFHRTFSNGYFHYRTFSKTPKLKFILAFDFNDLKGTAQKFKSAIFKFMNAFANWDTVKQKIIAATSFLFTKADVNTKIDILSKKIQTLRNSLTASMAQKQKKKFQQIIDQILTKNRLFFIQKPAKANQVTTNNTILQQVYQKSSFWERQINPVNKNCVDMSDINFSVANQILKQLENSDNQLYHQEFYHFMKFMQQRVNQIIVKHKGSLCHIITLLKQDAMESTQSHKFLGQMQKFNKDFYQFYQSFKDKRERTQANLFKLLQNEEGNDKNGHFNEQFQKQMRSVYFIKKFKVLQFLQNLYNNSRDTFIQISRTISELEGISNLFLSLFKKFTLLRVDKTDNQRIINKYSYIIQRLFQQYKIMTLILFTDPKAKEKFFNLKQGIDIFSVDLMTLVRDNLFSAVLGEINVQSIKQVFISTFNFSQLKVVNQQIISFFQSLNTTNQEAEFKVAQLIITYSQRLFQNSKIPTDQHKKFILQKLLKYRNRFYDKGQKLKAQGGKIITINKNIQIVMRFTQQIALILQSFNQFEDARQCYRTINDAQKIFQIYEIEAHLIKKNKQPYRQLLIKYGSEASKFYRKELALQCFQKAFSLSSSTQKVKEVSDIIVKVCTQIKSESSEDIYLKRFANQIVCTNFSQNLKGVIQLICLQ